MGNLWSMLRFWRFNKTQDEETDHNAYRILHPATQTHHPQTTLMRKLFSIPILIHIFIKSLLQNLWKSKKPDPLLPSQNPVPHISHNSPQTCRVVKSTPVSAYPLASEDEKGKNERAVPTITRYSPQILHQSGRVITSIPGSTYSFAGEAKIGVKSSKEENGKKNEEVVPTVNHHSPRFWPPAIVLDPKIQFQTGRVIKSIPGSEAITGVNQSKEEKGSKSEGVVATVTHHSPHFWPSSILLDPKTQFQTGRVIKSTPDSESVTGLKSSKKENGEKKEGVVPKVTHHSIHIGSHAISLDRKIQIQTGQVIKSTPVSESLTGLKSSKEEKEEKKEGVVPKVTHHSAQIGPPAISLEPKIQIQTGRVTKTIPGSEVLTGVKSSKEEKGKRNEGVVPKVTHHSAHIRLPAISLDPKIQIQTGRVTKSIPDLNCPLDGDDKAAGVKSSKGNKKKKNKGLVPKVTHDSAYIGTPAISPDGKIQFQTDRVTNSILGLKCPLASKDKAGVKSSKKEKGKKWERVVSLEIGRWIKHYSNRHRILLVGEGDFSFSVSLAVVFGSASNMIATSFDCKGFLRRNYEKAQSNMNELEKRGCIVMNEIDATTMANHELLGDQKFDRIVYNFPYAGFFKNLARSDILRLHKRLVKEFLKNAKEMITENGEIHISHKENNFHNEWNLESLASSHKLKLIEAVRFDRNDYPGYHPKYGFGGDKNFDCDPSKTYKFGYKRVRN